MTAASTSTEAVATGGESVPYLELWAIDGSYANEVDALARATLRIAADERGDGLSLTKTWTDPLRFDPSRHVSDSMQPRRALLPFGLGPRGCIGQLLATPHVSLRDHL